VVSVCKCGCESVSPILESGCCAWATTQLAVLGGVLGESYLFGHRL
jgi:hypothetical protein